MEIRSHHQQITINDQNVSGHAIVFYDPKDTATEFRSENFVERIPDDVEIDLGDYVFACLDHDEAAVLDHTDATLKLSRDRRGLSYSFPLRDTDPDINAYEAKPKVA